MIAYCLLILWYFAHSTKCKVATNSLSDSERARTQSPITCKCCKLHHLAKHSPRSDMHQAQTQPGVRFGFITTKKNYESANMIFSYLDSRYYRVHTLGELYSYVGSTFHGSMSFGKTNEITVLRSIVL